MTGWDPIWQVVFAVTAAAALLASSALFAWLWVIQLRIDRINRRIDELEPK